MSGIILRVACRFVLLFCLLLPAFTQIPVERQGDQRIESEQERKMQREQAKKLNQQRHQDLKQDTDKLLELATQLKHSVDQSNENTLSVDVIKKADEIERLAHRVKQKMKGY